MKIKLNVSRQSTDTDTGMQEVRRRGEVVDVPKTEAETLIKRGWAEPVKLPRKTDG